MWSIREGDIPRLTALIAAEPDRVNARVGEPGRGHRTPLHMVADWPGYFPNGPEVTRYLLAAGADPNVSTGGDRPETPLHWAASSDDVDVAEALVDGGADLAVPGGSIGTPLENAVGYGCWHVARLLVARGAAVDSAWVAAAMGLRPRLEELLGDAPGDDTVCQAFWHACAAGQRRVAEYLLSRGADLAWTPPYASGTALDAARGLSTRQEQVISWLESVGAPAS